MKTTVIEQAIALGNIEISTDQVGNIEVIQRWDGLQKETLIINPQNADKVALAISPNIKDLLQGAADAIRSGNQDRMNDAATDINEFLNQQK